MLEEVHEFDIVRLGGARIYDFLNSEVAEVRETLVLNADKKVNIQLLYIFPWVRVADNEFIVGIVI